MQGKKQIVDIHPQEGICNRVIKLALALRHNADMSQPVYYNWRRNGYSMVKKRFYELFEFAYEDYEVIEINRDFGTDDIWGSDWVNDGEYRNLARYYGARILDIVDGEVVEWNEESKGSIDKGLVYEAPLQLLNYYIPFFQALKPSKEVLARISQVKEKEYVSVHVRLNDIWKIWGLGSDKDLENYFSEMRCYPEGTAFFLACADRGVAERFKIEFLPGGGYRIIEIPNKDYASDIDAVSDLFLLSKGKSLIATWSSSFSYMAWWLSGCRMQVAVVGDSSTYIHGGVPEKWTSSFCLDMEPLMGERIILYGAGRVGQDYYAQFIQCKDIEIVAWIDQRWEEIRFDYASVTGISSLSQCDYDKIVIAVREEATAKEIENVLIRYGQPRDRIYWKKPNVCSRWCS